MFNRRAKTNKNSKSVRPDRPRSAKRPDSGDGVLQCSDELQEALELLSSNRDVLEKFLEDPRLRFSARLVEFQRSQSQSQKVAVVKPAGSITWAGRDDLDLAIPKASPKSARIVLLKPRFGKIGDAEMIRRLQDDLGHVQMDEATDSFRKPEAHSPKAASPAEEFRTPTSGRSWVSCSSSPASPLSESSVIREAKRRISERCSKVALAEARNQDCGSPGSSFNLSDVLALGSSKTEREPASLHSPRSNLAHESDDRKSKHGGSNLSWKGIVSSLFRNTVGEKSASSTARASDDCRDAQSVRRCDQDGPALSDLFDKESLSPTSFGASENLDEARDEQSPVSVLDLPFLFCDAIGVSQETLSRSSPIRSVARSLSEMNDAQPEAMSPTSKRLSRLFSRADEDESSLAFVQDVVSLAIMNGEIAIQWHPIGAPLSPWLLDECQCSSLDRAMTDRGWQSKQLLLFDCINEAIAVIGQTSMLAAYPWSCRPCHLEMNNGVWHSDSHIEIANSIWQVIRSWPPIDACSASCSGEDERARVKAMLRRESAGMAWHDAEWLAFFDWNDELCGAMLDDLVADLIVEL